MGRFMVGFITTRCTFGHGRHGLAGPAGCSAPPAAMSLAESFRFRLLMAMGVSGAVFKGACNTRACRNIAISI